MSRSAVPKLASLKTTGAGALAGVAGFVVVAGFIVGLGSLETAGSGVLLGWVPVIGGLAVAAGLGWCANRMLPSSRPWYLFACGALGVFLALTSPLLVYAVTGN